MTEVLGQGHRFLTLLLGLVGIAQLPEGSENPRIAGDRRVKPAGEVQGEDGGTAAISRLCSRWARAATRWPR
jgi:hypothetical protein